ncbi:MAG: exonuclease subunit SbcD [Clostridia bacterium]|nr:exonuclease subunit SbcD [Clostridia bacterium]
MSIKVLHSGDWHIGTYPGPEKNGENVRFLDICHCLDALVKRAGEENPDIIVIAGDIFHQAKVWADRGLRENRTATHYVRQLSMIAPVVIVRGTPNHDSEQQFQSLENTFLHDDSVHIITEPQVKKIYTYHGGAVQIAGLPGFDRGFYRAKHPGLSKEEENEVFTEELANLILGLKASCEVGTPTILVSHFTIPGCNMESGQTQFFSQFEPVVYPDTLMAAGFDLNCFGHIHRPQQIKEAGNTFYCGAVSAMNFNDEGQERGFYIHFIDEEKDRAVYSHFYTLPTRKFKTISLEDEDVAAINEGNAVIAEDVCEKIVRVLYNCTDEHNKAFNKAALEQQLYSAGAFWVQEITPQKITVSVNKDSLSDESGPEENLRQYFEEKGYEPAKIAEIIEAARPYISEATENTKGGAKSGLFTPLRIEVKNYRNYREESFDFDGIRFCTINGENGAGKSSLFMDAMLDALYEEPREGDLTGWICNDPEVRSGAIQFTFSIGDSTYRVTRTRQKSGKATLNLSELVDGEWQDRSAERYKDTQNIITQTIGMDSLTFKACALIMQDQYGLFLQADKEARMTILGNILGLGVYEKMEDLAADSLTKRNREIRALQDRVTDVTAKLPDADALAAEIEDAESYIAHFQGAVKEKAAEIDSTKVRLNTKVEAAQRAVRIQTNIASLSQKLAGATANKTSQTLIANGAMAVLSEEAAIKAGVAEYEALLEKEKALISARDRRDDLRKQKDKLAAEMQALDGDLTKIVSDMSEAVRAFNRIEDLLAGEEFLKMKHDEYHEASDKLEELQAAFPEYTDLVSKHNAAMMAFADLDSKTAAERKARLAEIKALTQRVELLENSGCPISEKASCRFLADALEAKAILPEKHKEYDQFEADAAQSVARARESVDLTLKAVQANKYTPEGVARLQSLVERLRAHEDKYLALDREKEKAAELKKKIEDLKERASTTDGKMKAVETEYVAACESLATAETAAEGYDLLAVQIKNARVWLDKEKDLPVARERLTAATARINELDAEIAQIEAEIAEKKAEHAHEKQTSEGAEELRGYVSQEETAIAYWQEEIRKQSMKLGALRKQEENAAADRATVAELMEQTESIGKLAAIDDDLKKAFSQDGIPHNVIRSIIPIFEATATGILGQMSGGKMSVEFVTEKVLKSNNKKEVTTLDIIINDCNTGRLPYMSRSGGERVKSALSVILALSEIKSTKAGVQLGFLFVDEPPFLDGQGVQAYCDALEAIQNRYSTLKIMAITHDPTMKSRFPQSVTIYKDANSSHVMMD